MKLQWFIKEKIMGFHPDKNVFIKISDFKKNKIYYLMITLETWYISFDVLWFHFNYYLKY